MRKHVPVKTDELEDKLELQHEELRKQIADGYQAYLRGETKDLDKCIAELRNDLNPQKTQGAMKRYDASPSLPNDSHKMTTLADAYHTASE